MKSLISILLSAILALMISQVLAGRYCVMNIQNQTPFVLNLVKIQQQQMLQWQCSESIYRNSTGNCFINPSDSLFIDQKKTFADASFKFNNTNNYLEIRFSTDARNIRFIEADVHTDRTFLGFKIYKSVQANQKYPYPGNSLFRNCLIKLILAQKNSGSFTLDGIINA